MKKTLRTLALGCLICLAQLWVGSDALAKARPPEQAAAAFYRWYMQSLCISQDPLTQSPTQLSAYVSKGLITELKRRMSRKGLHADYFIQAQEFLDDWITDISVAKPNISGNLATVVVTLGATEYTQRKLALTLIRDDGDWKIRMVRMA